MSRNNGKTLMTVCQAIVLRAALLLAVAGTAVVPVMADGRAVEGYMSAKFGMSGQEVLAAVERDEFVRLSDEVQEGDRVIRATRDRGWIKTGLIYVLPGKGGQLALVIEDYPGLVSAKPVAAELEKQYGKPVSEKVSEEMLKQMKDQLPPSVTKMSLWISRATGRDRFVRLLSFEDHLAVEYLDPLLMAGEAGAEPASTANP